MKRVVVISWKNRPENPVEVFSNLKILSESYPVYNYNTLNNYLSKGKTAYENEEVRIERKTVYTTAIPERKIALIAKRVKTKGHNEEKQNLDYWLSRPVAERLDAVTRYRFQVVGKNERMNRKFGLKRKMR